MRIKALYSTESPDEMGEVILSKGLRAIQPVIPILDNFSFSHPIGHADTFWTDERGAWLEGELDDGDYGVKVFVAPFGSFTRGETTDGVTEITAVNLHGLGLTAYPINPTIEPFEVLGEVEESSRSTVPKQPLST